MADSHPPGYPPGDLCLYLYLCLCLFLPVKKKSLSRAEAKTTEWSDKGAWLCSLCARIEDALTAVPLNPLPGNPTTASPREGRLQPRGGNHDRRALSRATLGSKHGR